MRGPRIKKIKKAVREYAAENLIGYTVKERECMIAASGCCSIEVVLEKGVAQQKKPKKKRKK